MKKLAEFLWIALFPAFILIMAIGLVVNQWLETMAKGVCP